MSKPLNYEQAGELKIGQVGISNLRIQTLDVAKLQSEMRDRVNRAPKMFEKAAVVLDFGALADVPSADQARELIAALREAGTLPVAIAYGTAAMEQLARELDFPVLAKFRESYAYGGENGGDAGASAGQPPAAAQQAPSPATAAPPGAAVSAAQPGMIHNTPIRSGQQIYAPNRDLTILTGVGAGAEALSDGSIHIYGPLRGRALAGAKGNEQARIFCREFDAQLVAIAGHYKVLEEVPAEFVGKPVQIWLEDGQLKFAVIE